MAARTNTMPSPSELRELFTCDARRGILTWKQRPLSHFKRKQDFITWNIKHSGKLAGSYVPGDYWYVKVNCVRYPIHRIIWTMINGPITDGLIIDHIDGDPKNNSISNIRMVTQLVNQKNRRIHITNKTGVPGVYVYDGKYRAGFMANGAAIHVGSFTNLEDAAAAIHARRIEHGFTNRHSGVNENAQ